MGFVTPLSRREVLSATLWAFLAAMFPWLRRREPTERYLYQLASFDIEQDERIVGLRQDVTIGQLTAQEQFERDFPSMTAWRFGDGDVHWEIRDVGGAAQPFVMTRRG